MGMIYMNNVTGIKIKHVGLGLLVLIIHVIIKLSLLYMGVILTNIVLITLSVLIINVLNNFQLRIMKSCTQEDVGEMEEKTHVQAQLVPLTVMGLSAYLRL